MIVTAEHKNIWIKVINSAVMAHQHNGIAVFIKIRCLDYPVRKQKPTVIFVPILVANRSANMSL